jgi:TonB family protein
VITLLAEAAARSLALGLIAALGLALTRTRSAHVQKTVWTTVLCASLVMPLLMYSPLGPTIPAPNILLTLRPSVVSEGHTGFGWFVVVTALYWVVAATLAFRYALGLVRMWAIRRKARPLNDTWTAGLDVRATKRIGVPATFGSSVLLPVEFATWSDRKRDAVIAHERSHVVERDCYLLWLARLHTCLFWFNPLAWWIQRKVAALAEATSDDAAVGIVGDRPAYAEILLEFASYGRAANGAVAPMARSCVSYRIERIISQTASSRMPTVKRRLLAIAALLPAVVFVALPLRGSTVGAARADVPTSSSPLNADASQADQTPRITNYGGLAELSKYYPPEARNRGIAGIVDLAVTLDAQGRATDTLILTEDPLDMGFGAAASAVAHTMEYSNPTGHRVQFTFRVKFALDNAHTPPADSASQP